MTEDSTVATAPAAAPDITERFTVETNIEPEKAEPEKVEPPKPEATEPEPKVEPPKPINPRTAQRKAERERLIRENAVLADKLKQFEQIKPAEAGTPKVRDLSKEPNIQDYDDAIEYTRDVARYDAMQTFKNETSRLQEEKLVEVTAQRAEILRAEKPDFDERVGSLMQSQLLTPDIEQALLASPFGADVSYHLANYGGDLMTLRGLPKEMLPKAIKAIEQFIQSKPEEKPRVTQAQPPITPPGVTAKTDRSVQSYTQEEIEEMPLSQYNALTNNKRR